MTSELSDGLAGAVALAAAGDEAAFARIVQAHHDDMTRVSFVICGDLDMADEVVQVAWPIIWRKFGTLRDPSRLRPWLVSVAANEARQLVRRRRRRTVVELAVFDGSRLAVVAEHAAESSGSDRAELEELVASIRIDPPRATQYSSP